MEQRGCAFTWDFAVEEALSVFAVVFIYVRGEMGNVSAF